MKKHGTYVPDDQHVALRTACGKDIVPTLSTVHVETVKQLEDVSCFNCRNTLLSRPLYHWAGKGYHYDMKA